MTLLAILSGALLPLASAWALGAVLVRRKDEPEIQFAAGAAGLSFAVFVLCLCGLAYWWAFLGLGLVAAVGWWRVRPTLSFEPLPRAALILAPYLVFYFVNALAPETVADGITYHLGLPAEYLRTGGFPDRVTFYGMIPQGMELLYTMAFAFGKHSAAKLIEFAFFVGTVPLLSLIHI